MPANRYPWFINHELNNPEVRILKDDDGKGNGYIRSMAWRPTFSFIFRRIVAVDYEPPHWETRVILINSGVCRRMGMMWFTCAHIYFNGRCALEVASPMSPVHGLIFRSPLYNFQVVHLGWCWLYPTTDMGRLLSQIQGWSTSLCTLNTLGSSRYHSLLRKCP